MKLPLLILNEDLEICFKNKIMSEIIDDDPIKLKQLFETQVYQVDQKSMDILQYNKDKISPQSLTNLSFININDLYTKQRCDSNKH